ncbi:MAG: carboxypeptidase regulatory-like domain-containing protein [Chloroflexi bacterium]|nr:carboxypeptidase regulatory-like domain-containing protein [Chloroflexota bacterium]
MQCKSCGTTVHGKYDFCPNCGAYIKHHSEHRLHLPSLHRPNPGRKAGAKPGALPEGRKEAKPASSALPVVPPQAAPAEPVAQATPSEGAPAEVSAPATSTQTPPLPESSKLAVQAAPTPPRAPTASRALVPARARALSRTSVQTVRVRRRDGTPTIAAAIIFMGAWLLALLVGFGAAGVYQGLQDRDRVALNTAQQHKDAAKAYLKDGNLELAYQELRYAQQFNPNDKEIKDLLASLQKQTAPVAAGQPLPTPTLSQVSQDEILGAAYQQAKDAYDKQDYETALSMLDGLRRVQPDYKKADVEQMLYNGNLTLARQFLKDERWEEAVQRFDKALAIRKDDHVQLERYLASVYLRGLSAWSADWKRAVESFTELVRINPDYQDSRSRLYQAYISYGDYLMERGGSCLAIDAYSGALGMNATATNQSKYNAAVAACQSGGGVPPTPGATRPPVTSGPTPTPSAVPGAKYRVQMQGTQATNDENGSIRGQVTDKTSKPVKGLEMVAVSATKNYQRTETTDDFGFYGFDGLDPDTYTVRIKSDPASSSPPVTVGRRVREIISFFQN